MVSDILRQIRLATGAGVGMSKFVITEETYVCTMTLEIEYEDARRLSTASIDAVQALADRAKAILESERERAKRSTY